MSRVYDQFEAELPVAADQQVRTLFDLGIVGLLLLVPVVAAELYFATADEDYVRRNVGVEIGSRFTGNVFTARMGCPRAETFEVVFRAWNKRDARTFLAQRRPDCATAHLMEGADVYRTRLWASR